MTDLKTKGEAHGYSDYSRNQIKRKQEFDKALDNFMKFLACLFAIIVLFVINRFVCY
jgi:hypothetical protein